MTNGKAVIEMDEGGQKSEGNVVARLPKEQLKSLFYLFAGKPDSRIKVFHKPLFIEVDDIIELNECITRKLTIHNIDAQITSLSVGYEGADIQEFGTWAEFCEHHWQTPDRVEEIVVKWDFMVAIKGYDAPQRHTLLVRISADMKPGKFMQMMVSGNSDEFDKVDVLTAPAFCRVDFINAQLSKELINEVDEWVKGRKEPTLVTDFYYWMKKRRQTLAEAIHHSVVLVFTILWVAILKWIDTNIYSGQISLVNLAIWVFVGIYGFNPVSKVGHSLASRVYQTLEEINGKKVVFSFTTGDKKFNAESIERNKKRGKAFLKKTIWTLALNIVAGLVAAYLYTTS